MKNPPANWRVIVTYNYERPDQLLCMGRSSIEVRRLYADSFYTFVSKEDISYIKRIILQTWSGKLLKGNWVNQTNFGIPRKSITAADLE